MSSVYVNGGMGGGGGGRGEAENYGKVTAKEKVVGI